MSLLRKLRIAAVAVMFAGTSMATVAHAESQNQNENLIIGGEASSTPWVVQLNFTAGGGSSSCSGSQINDEWVITAKHCTSGASNMKVTQPTTGKTVSAESLHNAPSGDVALIKLDSPATLSSYGSLDLSYSPSAGDSGQIYGYGLGANDVPTNSLRTASVTVTGSSSDAYGAPAVQLQGVSGAANRGDSGGPLVVGGSIVAVCSTGEANPGSNINSQSNYAVLSNNAAWIQQTTNVDLGLAEVVG